MSNENESTPRPSLVVCAKSHAEEDMAEWPFEMVSRERLARLSRSDLLMMEGSMMRVLLELELQHKSKKAKAQLRVVD